MAVVIIRVEHGWISILEGPFWLLWIRNGVPQGGKPVRRLVVAWSKDHETRDHGGGWGM